MSSIRETAEQITLEVAKICGCEWERCTTVRSATTNAIEQALRNERERAAKIAKTMALGETYGTGRRKAVNIAAAIRKED